MSGEMILAVAVGGVMIAMGVIAYVCTLRSYRDDDRNGSEGGRRLRSRARSK
ncbi:MAG: hypothetical protein QF609_09240 [Gammaproteobacteria bacterium]|jgi:hypothetical protein|nr:hypothetical protein [Gammaproteobacteria bacterium]